MKIILSTTIGHNPGDEIIARGVRRLVDRLVNDKAQYITYNRNPDLQEGPGDNRNQRLNLVGNYFTDHELIKHADMTVLAGSPEWFGGPMRLLYESIMVHRPAHKLVAIGVGLGNPNSELTPLDIDILSRPETRIVTRSQETTDFLRNSGIHSTAMVCPALFAFEAQRVKMHPPGKPLFILQKPGNDWHEIPSQLLLGDGAQLSGRDVLTLHVKEYLHYAQMKQCNVHYANTPDEFYKIVRQYPSVISTRLHGAIGALSLGRPAVVVSNGDYRIETAANMFGAYLPVCDNIYKAEHPSYFLDYRSYQCREFDKYIEVLL